MTEQRLYPIVLVAWVALAAITFFVLLGRAAPYGRHGRSGWGPMLPARFGWMLMEGPAAIVILVFAIPTMLRARWPLGWLLLALWELHYIHRGFVFPARLRTARPMPLAIAAMALCFNVVNGWLVGRGLTRFGPELGRAALANPRVVGGVVLFVVGLTINWNADARLVRLRRERGDYAIPHGGLYRWVSCPNYLGELVEWLGFAIASGSLAVLVFFVWTFANLVPRARTHHRWYRERFADYPVERRALIPFVW